MSTAALPIIKRGEQLYAQVKWGESYLSLLLGLIVVFFLGTILIFSIHQYKKGLLPFNTAENKITHSNNQILTKTGSFISHSVFVQSLMLSKKKTGQGVLSDHAYTVKAGDDLWDIAVQEYGNGMRWTDIATTNNLQNPDNLNEGTVLTIPH